MSAESRRSDKVSCRSRQLSQSSVLPSKILHLFLSRIPEHPVLQVSETSVAPHSASYDATDSLKHRWVQRIDLVD